MLCRVGADDENTDFDLYTEQGQVIRRGSFLLQHVDQFSAMIEVQDTNARHQRAY
jgi:hypothetical protein